MSSNSVQDRALVIVPTFNERDNIERVIHRLFTAASNRVDLLVVDDNSPDGTADVVKRLSAERDHVHLIERPRRLGLGTAYVTGFRWGLERRYGAMVEMDADLSHDPADVPRLLDGLVESDLVIGSRYVSGGRVENWSVFRRGLSMAANLFVRLALGSAIRDSTAGFRAYRAEMLRRMDLESIRSEGYAFQIETTRRVEKAGARITEIPITFIERTAGKSKMGIRIVVEALVYVAGWGLIDRLGRLRRFLLRYPPDKSSSNMR